MDEQRLSGVGNLLKQLRIAAQMTQEDLAGAANMSLRTLSDIERGVTHKTHKRTAEALADGLNLAEPVRGRFIAAARGLGPIKGVLETASRDEASSVSSGGVHLSAPAQLPHSMNVFSGRQAEIEWLNTLLPADEGDLQRAVPIAVISGTAGVGKTTLAVYWAHQISHCFPDGQLYVNLRGYEPSGPAMDPAEAIRGFLAALGLLADRIPVDLGAQAALYRTLLTGRRMLIVLDNAGDAEQIRPLLPGASTCLVLVTSRSQLLSLVVTDGAHPRTLDLLTPGQARELLVGRLGRSRIVAEEAAINDIVDFCAGLPLALSIVGARAAATPQSALGELARELHETGDVLDVLDAGDPRADIRAVFFWSYRSLTEPAAKVFRLLGLHTGPDISAAAAASLVGLPVRQVRAHLAELVMAHLITQRQDGRLSFHDLLRAYASELAHKYETVEERRAVIHRSLDHYLHSAYRADRLLRPDRDDVIILASTAPLVTPEKPRDYQQALSWFDTEYPVLLTSLHQAFIHELDGQTWQLAWSMMTFFDLRGHWHDAATMLTTAVAAADRLAEPSGQVKSLMNLAYACSPLGRFADARQYLLAALALYETLGDQTGEAYAHGNLSQICGRQGSYQEGLHHAQHAADLFRKAGRRTGEARALNSIGWLRTRLGDYETGLTYCGLALDIQQDEGDQIGQADTLDSMAMAYRQLGRYEDASVACQQALNLYRRLGDRYGEANALAGLGDALLASGDASGADSAWRLALIIFDDLDHPDAAQVRDKLGVRSAHDSEDLPLQSEGL